MNINLEKKMIHIVTANTPIGNIVLGGDDRYLYFSIFEDDNQLDDVIKDITSRYGFKISNSHNKLTNKAIAELSEYFDGKREKFTIPLSLSGTTFCNSVWNVLKEIPYGSTITYKQEALMLGKRCFRAVGTANGRNKLLIFIPCHRVIASNGSLGGFSSGLWRKKFLLNLEKLT